MAVYGVATDNPFALLVDDEQNDDAERLAETVTIPTKQKPQTPTATSSTGIALTDFVPLSQRYRPLAVRGGGGRGRGTGRGARRPDALSRETSYEGGDYGRGFEGARQHQAPRAPRGRGRGAVPPGRIGKRQYDRRDGTGRG